MSEKKGKTEAEKRQEKQESTDESKAWIER